MRYVHPKTDATAQNGRSHNYLWHKMLALLSVHAHHSIRKIEEKTYTIPLLLPSLHSHLIKSLRPLPRRPTPRRLCRLLSRRLPRLQSPSYLRGRGSLLSRRQRIRRHCRRRCFFPRRSCGRSCSRVTCPSAPAALLSRSAIEARGSVSCACGAILVEEGLFLGLEGRDVADVLAGVLRSLVRG